MRAWQCPCGQRDFTLYSRAALTVNVIQSYSVLVLVSQFFSGVCMAGMYVQEVSHRACRPFGKG